MSDSQENVNKRQHEDDGAEQQVKRTRYQYNYDDLITVSAGKHEITFQVHRDTICERSRFFEAAVSTERWTEGKENLVRLPEVQACEFQMYVHWAYTGKLSPETLWQQDNLDSDKIQRAYYAAYILGDVLDDSDLRTLSLDTIITKCVTWEYMPNLKTCLEVWERTPPGSPLRAFIVAFKASSETRLGFSKYVEKLPREFLEEMAVLFMTQRSDEREDPEEFAARIRAKLLPERP